MPSIDSLIVQANNLLLLLRKSTKLTPISGGTPAEIDPYAASQIKTLIKVATDIRDLYIHSLAERDVKQKDIAAMFNITPARICQILANDSGGKNGK